MYPVLGGDVTGIEADGIGPVSVPSTIRVSALKAARCHFGKATLKL